LFSFDLNPIDSFWAESWSLVEFTQLWGSSGQLRGDLPGGFAIINDGSGKASVLVVQVDEIAVDWVIQLGTQPVRFFGGVDGDDVAVGRLQATTPLNPLRQFAVRWWIREDTPVHTNQQVDHCVRIVG
jgi:hypothetical protein